MTWQELLDKHFPDGALVEWPDLDMLFHVPRFFVRHEAPVPLVEYFPIDAPQPPPPLRWTSYVQIHSNPRVMKVVTPDRILKISDALSAFEIDALKDKSDPMEIE